MTRKLIFLAFLPLLSIACQEHDAAEPQAPSIAFEGQIEPKLVGVWKPEKGDVKMTMSKDGTAETSGQVVTPGGKIMTRNSGKWLAKNDSLFFRYNGPDGKTLGDATQYRWALEGDKLTLTRGSKNLKFVYHREK